MKGNTRILIKTTALVFAFMLVLGVGIMSLSFSHSGVKPNDDNFLTPDLAITAPISQELLQRKFNTYNTVTEENGKSVVTIFSEEQISDFNDRRNNGEWFWLSSEEMLFIINNTVELFKTYDIVCIRDLDGNLNKYYGLSFFSSEEYYASFNGFDLGVTDASFDIYKDIYKTIFHRTKTLNSAVYSSLGGSPHYVVFTDILTRLSSEQIHTLRLNRNPWYSESDSSDENNFSVWTFNNDLTYIYYDTDISINDLNFKTSEGIILYPNSFVIKNASIYKYDNQDKTVVIELYASTTQALTARIRLNSHTDEEQIKKIQELLSTVENNIESSGNTEQKSVYTAVIYLNGFKLYGDECPPIKYSPDGNLDYFSFADDEDIFDTDILFLKGCQSLAEYINEILSQQLTK